MTSTSDRLFRQQLLLTLLGSALLAVAVAYYNIRWQPPLGPEVIELASALHWSTEDETGTPVTLPNDWLLLGYRGAEHYYQISFETTGDAGEIWGILLGSVNLNAAVSLNGTALGSFGNMQEPISHNWSRPLHFAVPPRLLRAGANQLEVRVVSFPPGHGSLGRVYVGPRAQILATEALMHRVAVELPRAISVFSLLIGLVALGLWLLRRTDTEYAWFAATTLLWTLHSLKYHVADIPVSSQFWAWFLFLTSISASYPMFLFMQRFNGLQQPTLERCAYLLWLVSIIAITVPMLLGLQQMYPIAEVMYGISFAVSVYSFYKISKHSIRTRSKESMLLATTISFLVIIVAHDVLLIYGYLDRTVGQLVIYAVPLLLGGFGLIMLRRFAVALTEREAMLHNLEQRVAQATSRIVELETDKALAHQRETIMRDMHDGVGGQLVSSLALLESTNQAPAALKDTITGALTDLRLMIDSLDTQNGDLGLLLGALRERMEPILDCAGIQSSWEIGVLPTTQHRSAHDSLQILRCLQEILTNAIKHAQASQISVSIAHQPQSGSTTIRVKDNGIGFEPATVRRGRGLNNLQRRAQDLRATLAQRSGADGCETTLQLTDSTT
ncbi:MAG: ATP-binding protein [Pseudomonadales bacterium]